MYAIKKAFCFSVSAVILCGGSDTVYASALDVSPDRHTTFTTELESTDAYQIASAVFLPDALEKGLKFDGHKFPGGSEGGYGKGDGCDSRYNLSECPDKGKCDRCAFANKFYLKGCDNGYKISGNSCSASSCSALNTSYLSTIPTNQICTKVTEGGLTCYKNCRNISCSGYNVNCNNSISAINIASSTVCPDCLSADANCSPKLCKITECNNGYKVNNDGSACIEADDTCPSGYYKSCDTGIQGDPKYTDKGTACYQCKPEEPVCDSSYQYDANNCPAGTKVLCGNICGEKYTECKIRPFPFFGYNETFSYYGWTFTNVKTGNREMTACPDYEANRDFYNAVQDDADINLHEVLPYVRISKNISFTLPYATACYSGERACLDVFLKLQKDKEATLDKDINCGNLSFHFDQYLGSSNNTYTLNGNGHTMTFDTHTDSAFSMMNTSNQFSINDVKIIYKNSNSSEFMKYPCDDKIGHPSLFLSLQEGQIKLTNVDIYLDGNTYVDLRNADFYGTNTIKISLSVRGERSYSPDFTFNRIYGTVNLLLSDRNDSFTYYVDVQELVNGVFNLKAEGPAVFTKPTKYENYKINLCFKKYGNIDDENESSAEINSNISFGNTIKPDYDTNVIKDICDKDIFSGW